VNTTFALIAVFVLVGINAFFVAVEFALVAIDRSKVAVEAEKGSRTWGVISKLLRQLSYHLSGAQLGITMSSLLIGFLVEDLAADLLSPRLEPILGSIASGGLGIFIGVVIATALQMVYGELVPKTIAISEPGRVLRVLARPAQLYGIVAKPLIGAANGAANVITRRLGHEVVEELHSIQSLEELEQVIRSSGAEGTLDSRNVTLLTRSIRFGDKTVADVLVPRVELTAIEADKSVQDLSDLAVDSGHSRFVVFGQDLDDVQGVVHVKQVHSVPAAKRAATPVQELVRQAFVVPEARDLESMLVEMRRTRTHLAVVADEHGGTAGIVTIEDIVEEIVGEIDDEYDPTPEVQIVRERDSLVLGGSLHPDEVEEASGFVMPEGDYETLAGFALDQLQRIPRAGEIFEWGGWILEVVEMDRWRISTVRLIAPREATTR